MEKFSERMNIKKVRNSLQIESIDLELRTSLWNLILKYYFFDFEEYLPIKTNNLVTYILNRLWDEYFKLPLDTLEYFWGKNLKQIRSYFFNASWFEVYDLVEFLANIHPSEELNKIFIQDSNKILEREGAGYRFISNKITQITSESEIKEIEESLIKTQTKNLSPVNTHLIKGLSYLSDKKSPDYKNSIKESISAVEVMCNLILGTKNTTLGDALKKIETEGKINMHGAFKNGLSSLYGFTSDAGGVRHGSLDMSKVDSNDARFMLITCSAFVNYLISKAQEAGISL